VSHGGTFPPLPPLLGTPPPSEPPVLVESDPAPRPLARWRLIVALGILALYVIVPAVIGAGRTVGDASVLPSSVAAVFVLCAWELTLFALAFSVAGVLARFRTDDLRLRWRGGWWVLPRSIGWSLALRLGVGVILAGCLVIYRFVSGASLEDLAGFRPEVEAMVDIDALRNPVYMVLMLTVVSFVLAGLREELWRAGMIALLGAAFPRVFGGDRGAWFAIIPVALLFGLGHTAQGPVGVIATTMLGIGLGAIMVFHRSIWDAVLAHGFFNAATFAILPWLSDQFPDILALLEHSSRAGLAV